ncbi:MAG: VanZ family protein [Flavobacteriales bacterium]|nr:VanZ family protein [Flavobacteriales bacterium]
MMRTWGWPLLWALLILLLCLMPGAALPAWHWADLFSIDKLVHAGLFAVLVLLVLRALPDPTLKAAAMAAMACVAYGGALELMQQFPALGRRGDWNDFLANGIGVGLGWAWQRRLWAKRRARITGSNA